MGIHGDNTMNCGSGMGTDCFGTGRARRETFLRFIRLPELVTRSCTKAAIYAERFNAISHFVGIGLSMFFSGWAFKAVSMNFSPAKLISVIVYSVSMIVLYSMSGTYHCLSSGRLKQIFRVLDHSTIFLLIAGCYTPFCAICLWDYPIGRFILGFEWTMAAVGILLNLRDMSSKFVRIFSQISYLVMGWMVVFAIRLLLAMLPLSCIIWLAVGGVCYTIGIVFYLIGKKHCVMHCVWHVWVLLGSVFQFISLAMIL